MTDPRSPNGVFQTTGESAETKQRRPFYVRSSSLALSAALGLGLLAPLAVSGIFTTAQPARAAEAVIPDSFVAPSGFEDLVEAVMPAVVSVQVRSAAPVETSNND
ncbi:MAG: hypothetical protein KI785_11260, partial [Devosiaceae bacterium]|nr:hypothetical protein [Devosiaceae bacterium MH13]